MACFPALKRMIDRALNVRIEMHRIDEFYPGKAVGQRRYRRANRFETLAEIFAAMPAASRFCREVLVGQKWRKHSREIRVRFASSGQGDCKLPVRKPASTCATGILR